MAAGNFYGVSGTVYENGTFYMSSTARYEGLNNNNIVLRLDYTPCSGIQWNLVNRANGAVFTGTTTYDSPATKTIATGVRAGTYFYNRYAAHYANAGCGNYNFSGAESY